MEYSASFQTTNNTSTEGADNPAAPRPLHPSSFSRLFSPNRSPASLSSRRSARLQQRSMEWYYGWVLRQYSIVGSGSCFKLADQIGFVDYVVTATTPARHSERERDKAKPILTTRTRTALNCRRVGSWDQSPEQRSLFHFILKWSLTHPLAAFADIK